MSTVSLSKAGRWIPLIVLLLSVLAFSPDAAAQSRERGRSGTTKKARVEQPDRTKTRQRSRTPRASAKKEETRSQARTARSQTQPRQKAARSTSQSRSREAKQPRADTRQRARPTTPPKAQTQPRARQPESRQQRSRDTAAERGRTRQGRGTTRGGNDATTQPPRARNGGDFEVGTGRNGGEGSGTQARRPRGQQAEQDRRDTPSRAPRGTVTTPSRRVDRQADRRVDRQADRRVDRQADRRVDRQADRRVDRNPRNDRYRRDAGDRANVGSRRVGRSPRYQQRDTWRSHYERDRQYKRKHYKRRYYPKKKIYHRPVVVRPYIHIDIDWPWEHRYVHGWRPRYVYKQVIYVEAGWGSRHRRKAQIDVRTQYYHQLRSATHNRAEVDIYIEQIELYEDGRYLGQIHHIPEDLGRIRATVYRDGRVRFDRDVFLLGDAYTGFEMISTRYYDGFVLDAYRASHGLRVGAVDLRRERVVRTRYSRLFDPYDFQGYVPVSLLPEDTGWILDYGRASFSGVYYDDDPYYYGGYSGYGDDYDDPYYGDDYYEEDYYEDSRGRPYYSVRSTVAEANFGVSALSKTSNRTYRTALGAQIQLQREAEFVRVK